MSCRILVVEDNPGDVELVHVYVKKQLPGVLMETAATLTEAIEVLETGDFELVFADLGLPDERGVAVVDRLRQNCDVPIIVLTGTSELSVARAAVEAGADDFIVKSTMSDYSFSQAVRLVLSRREHQRRFETTLGRRHLNQTIRHLERRQSSRDAIARGIEGLLAKLDEALNPTDGESKTAAELDDHVADLRADLKHLQQTYDQTDGLLLKNKYEQISLRNVVDRAITSARFSMPESAVEVVADKLPDFELLADPRQLSFATAAVIENAVWANQDMGLVEVGVRSLTGRIAIDIRDTGTGFTDKSRDLAFEPYYSTKSNGIGLGLTLARRIVREHGGDLAITSNSSSGATMSIVFPTPGTEGLDLESDWLEQ